MLKGKSTYVQEMGVNAFSYHSIDGNEVLILESGEYFVLLDDAWRVLEDADALELGTPDDDLALRLLAIDPFEPWWMSHLAASDSTNVGADVYRKGDTEPNPGTIARFDDIEGFGISPFVATYAFFPETTEFAWVIHDVTPSNIGENECATVVTYLDIEFGDRERNPLFDSATLIEPDPGPTLSIEQVNATGWKIYDDGTAEVTLSTFATSTGGQDEYTIELTARHVAPDDCDPVLSIPNEEASEGDSIKVAFCLSDEPSQFSVAFAAIDSDGEEAARVERTVSFDPPLTPRQTFGITNHEIEGFNPDCTTTVSLKASAPPGLFDVKPSVNAQVRCIGDFECAYATIARQDPSDPTKMELEANVPHGVRAVSIEIQQRLPDDTPVLHIVREHEIDIPVASAPSVTYQGAEVLSYNNDGSANVSLSYSVSEPVDWPFAQLSVAVSCLPPTPCEGQYQVAYPFRDNSGNFEFAVDISGVQTKGAIISTEISSPDLRWSSPRAVTLMDDIGLELPAQPEFDLSWSIPEPVALGYFMDGTALVRVEAEVANQGSTQGFDVAIDKVCNAVQGEARDCWDSDARITLGTGSRTGRVPLGELRLDQGTNEFIIEANGETASATVHVEERIVGITSELWECFEDVEVIQWSTCGGFPSSTIKKWSADQVNVYREGDPEYVAIFDEILVNMGEVTGIEYVLVDDYQSAQIEAYVGHEGHPRVLEVLGQNCSEHWDCNRVWSTRDNDSMDQGILGVRKRDTLRRNVRLSLQDEIRIAMTHHFRYVAIPHHNDDRPFSPDNLVKPQYLRADDIQMFRMVYSPLVKAGMTKGELREKVVFAEDTFDYDEERDADLDLLVYRARRVLQRAGAIQVQMSGSYACGRARENEPRDITASFWDFQYDHSAGKMVEHGERAAVRLAGGAEEGYTPEPFGGRWAMIAVFTAGSISGCIKRTPT